MFFKKFKTPGIAHVAYIFGDKEEAVVVDPRRDVDEYLRFARDNSLQLKLILETHRQEDFVIGSRELSKITGAKIVTLDHELFGHSDIRLKDREDLKIKGLTIRPLHTPGHTPESTCYAVYLDDAPGPLGVCSPEIRSSLAKRVEQIFLTRSRLAKTQACFTIRFAPSWLRSGLRRMSGPRTVQVPSAAATSQSGTNPRWGSRA